MFSIIMQRVGGFRRKSRHKLRKNVRSKGKISLSRYFQDLKVGDAVALISEPAVQKGMYWPKFYGKSGLVKSKRGKCYMVDIKTGNQIKTVIVHPVHLRKL